MLSNAFLAFLILQLRYRQNSYLERAVARVFAAGVVHGGVAGGGCNRNVSWKDLVEHGEHRCRTPKARKSWAKHGKTWQHGVSDK